MKQINNISNGEVLYLERRGCEFSAHDAELLTDSDVGNCRVCTVGECIPMPNGKNYFFEFTLCDRWHVRKENKRTGNPLKHPITETTMKNAFHVSTQFTDENGQSWRNCELEQNAWNAEPQKYTERAILDYINSVSMAHYSRIEYVEIIDVLIDDSRNYTPRSLIHEYAKANNLEEVTTKYFSYRLKLYSGLYEYDHLHEAVVDRYGRAIKAGKVCVSLYLKRVSC